MRIPKNIIVKNKYTSGNEFMLIDSYKEYVGYYYEMNNKTFIGKEFNVTSPEIVKIDSNRVNLLLTNPSTYAYGKISKFKINNIILKSHIFKKEAQENYTRYFSSQSNIIPTIIREINEDTYNEVIQNPIYKVVSLIYFNNSGFDGNEVIKADKILPGIKIFLENQN